LKNLRDVFIKSSRRVAEDFAKTFFSENKHLSMGWGIDLKSRIFITVGRRPAEKSVAYFHILLWAMCGSLFISAIFVP
jgi:hypothetical protein